MKLLRSLTLDLVRRLYRLRVRGLEHLPGSDRGALLVANHITWIDAFVITAACERPVRFLIHRSFLDVPLVGWFVRRFDVIPISESRAREGIRATAEAIAGGDLVCLFPEGQLSRSGLLNPIRKGVTLIARHANAPVLPLFLDGLWGSIFSFEGGRFFWKWPRRLPRPVQVVIGTAIPADQVTPAGIHHQLQALSVDAAATRDDLIRPLAEAALQALRRRPARPLFIERTRAGKGGGRERRKVSRAATIAAAIALGERWRQTLPDDEIRVGILLPGGAAAAFLNLGLVFAGRVPINLPFTGEPEALADALSELGVRTVLTSRAFSAALEGFPWRGEPGRFVDLRAEIDAAGSVRMLIERVRACFEPGGMARRRLARLLDRPAEAEAFGYLGPDPADESSLRATLLSGFQVQAAVSSLLGGQMLPRRGERIFCEHPLDCAVGALFCLWAPVLGGATTVSRSPALRGGDESWRIESVLRTEKATALVGGALLRQQIAKLEDEWHPDLANHLDRYYSFEPRLATSEGREDAERLEQRTGFPLCHGWASESRGAIISLSLPDHVETRKDLPGQPGRRGNALGRLLSGVALVESGSDTPPDLLLPTPDGTTRHPAGLKASVDDSGFVVLGGPTGEPVASSADSD